LASPTECFSRSISADEVNCAETAVIGCIQRASFIKEIDALSKDDHSTVA
jgi:hypothetical protein